jgi:hypothetical protein
MADANLRPAETRSLVDRITILVALMTSVAGAVVSILNAMFFLADRRDQARKEAFDDQVVIAKTYFDTFTRLPVGEFCGRQRDALLFGRTSLKLANLDESAVTAELNAPASGGRRADENHTGVGAVAILIFSDVLQRSKSQCDQSAVSVPAAAPGALVVATANGSSVASSYDLKQQAAAAPQPAPAQFTVWIQYAAGSGDQALARDMQSRLQAGGVYSVPGIQGVAAVPDHDQIRLFHRSDEAVGRKVAAAIGLGDAQIVSLDKAYPNLPNGVLEVWLKRRSAQ